MQRAVEISRMAQSSGGHRPGNIHGESESGEISEEEEYSPE